MSKDRNFRILLQINLEDSVNNPKVKKMEDVELVLRFFSLNNDNYVTTPKVLLQAGSIG